MKKKMTTHLKEETPPNPPPHLDVNYVQADEDHRRQVKDPSESGRGVVMTGGDVPCAKKARTLTIK